MPPFHASVGGHIRHALDIFNCILDGAPDGRVDLSARKRDLDVERCRQRGISELRTSRDRLEELKGADFKQLVEVRDDLGRGLVTHTYTFGAALLQAHSHLLHHQACIGYVLSGLGLEAPDSRFGLNPTTPEHV